MEDCIFCNIVKGLMPAYKIYEDDMCLAFLDIFPRVKGHTLLIPKKHYRWVYDVPEFGAYWETARTVAKVVQQSTNARFTSFVTVGEAVHHAHIHILPQQDAGPEGITFTKVLQFTKEEYDQLSGSIRSSFDS